MTAPAISHRTARDFDTRPGLKYLLMKVSGVCGAANLYRQSAMSFNLYFQTLLSAALSQAEGVTAQQVPQLVFKVSLISVTNTGGSRGI